MFQDQKSSSLEISLCTKEMSIYAVEAYCTHFLHRFRPLACNKTVTKSILTCLSMFQNFRPGLFPIGARPIVMDSSVVNSLSKALWKKSRKQSLFALYHPFVVSLAAGSLRIEAFRRYIAQDAFFLQAFAKAYGLALQKIDDENAKLSIRQLKCAVAEELRLHSSLAQAWGVDFTEECQPSIATSTYTDFLIRLAASSSKAVGRDALPENRKLAAFTIAAMTPCMRLYAFLGQEIANKVNINEKNFLYHGWVDTYSSESFEQSASQIEQLLDSLAHSLVDEELKELESLYYQALNFELEFFSAQSHCQSAFVPFFKRQTFCDLSYLLVSDFDSTCSINDSCTVLAEVSLISANKRQQDGREESCRSELRRQWNLLERSYVEGYNNSLTDILPHQEGSSNRPYDYHGLEVALERISHFEMQSNSKVEEAGVLKGLDMEDVKNAGRHICLQAGCGDFLKEVSFFSNVATHVISVCWSKTLIQGAFLNGDIPIINVHANELDSIGFISTGGILHVVETPVDKEILFDSLLKRMEETHLKKIKTVYIGDSVADLLCLLKADVGIVVGSNSNLQKVANAFGVTFTPLYKGAIEMERVNLKSQQGVLYTVMDWYEIHAFLLGSS